VSSGGFASTVTDEWLLSSPGGVGPVAARVRTGRIVSPSCLPSRLAKNLEYSFGVWRSSIATSGDERVLISRLIYSIAPFLSCSVRLLFLSSCRLVSACVFGVTDIKP
jgi:hypothetical protein